MKKLFTKIYNLSATGGDNYKWKETETSLLCLENGWHLIKIIAKAQNSNQKGSTDDDDLRMILNGYELGKYEIPQGKEHYEGFDNAASWNGATLKGNSKTIYLFFYATQVGNNQLQFYADGKPHLESIEFYKLTTNETFRLQDLNPSNIEDVDRSGIPWLSFIFIGPQPKIFEITASAQSGKQKGSADGDNLKILVNGKIIQNEKAPTSDKYKNFYFSGDLGLAIHGIKKISYTTNKVDDSHYEVRINLYDIYDFDPKADYKLDMKEELVKLADLAETLGVIKNFEILIETHETF